MLDHLRRHTERGRPRPGVDRRRVHDRPAAARRADGYSRRAPTSTGSRPWPRSGVTWNSVGMPGDSLDHAVESLEQYGAEVISQSTR